MKEMQLSREEKAILEDYLNRKRDTVPNYIRDRIEALYALGSQKVHNWGRAITPEIVYYHPTTPRLVKDVIRDLYGDRHGNAGAFYVEFCHPSDDK